MTYGVPSLTTGLYYYNGRLSIHTSNSVYFDISSYALSANKNQEKQYTALRYVCRIAGNQVCQNSRYWFILNLGSDEIQILPLDQYYDLSFQEERDDK